MPTVRKTLTGRGRDIGCPIPPSRPGEFHPEPLTEPCVNLSIYTARATHCRLLPSITTIEFLRFPVDPYDPDAGDLPPSLHGHYPASSLLRSSPPLAGSSALSASRFYRLSLFPWQSQPGSQVPYESPDQTHACSAPDTTDRKSTRLN